MTEKIWPYYGFSMWRGIIKLNPTMAQIGSDIARQYGLTLNHLCGSSHAKPIVRARWHVMAILQEEGRTKSEISRFLNRDRATITYGLKHHKGTYVNV